MTGRKIHAAAGEWLLVRYERAGKWYIEYEPKNGRERRHVKIQEAVLTATMWEEIASGTIYFGTRGGSTFDRLVRKRQAATSNDGEDSSPDGERGS